MRQHGPSKRRTWRKLHLAVDPDTQEIVAEVLTTNAGHDADQADALLEEVPGEIDSVTADGAFDKWKVYHAIERRGARPNILPATTPRSSGTPTRLGHAWLATRPFA